MGAEFSLYLRKKDEKDNSENILLFYFGSENAYYLYHNDTGIEDTCNNVRGDDIPYKVFTEEHYRKIIITLDNSISIKKSVIKKLEKEIENMSKLLPSAITENIYNKIKDDIFDITEELNYTQDFINNCLYMQKHFDFAKSVLELNSEDYELVYMWGN